MGRIVDEHGVVWFDSVEFCELHHDVRYRVSEDGDWVWCPECDEHCGGGDIPARLNNEFNNVIN